jgi:hypothetical protein
MVAAPRKHRVLRFLGLALGGIVAVFLVCRDIAALVVFLRRRNQHHPGSGSS